MDIKSRQKILYIDDNAPARALVSRLLGGEYIVLEAATPLSGIELARDTNPDLILIVINLPDLSGHAVATRLRSLLPRTPLVALTADTSPGARERALVAGCVGYITKPVDVDSFPGQIASFLDGKREFLPDETGHSKAYLAQLVERLEEKVRELTSVADRNTFLNEQNKRFITLLQRRQRLLEAAARVSRIISSILDLDQLLNDTVDVICEEYNFYYAGIFLLDPEGEWAFLKAGYGPAGEKLITDGHKLKVGGRSMIGNAISERGVRIALDFGAEAVHFRNPYLPQTRSEMALPLIFKDKVFGALSV